MSEDAASGQQLADISKRVWIRWGDGEPFENTSTLVLTAPSQTFIDIRVLKLPLPRASDLNHVDSAIDISRLDWAFAGVAATEYRDGICHKTWTHHVDSRYAYGDKPPLDEGDMFPEPDGVLCREKGRMVNPDTGRISHYEEMWESVEAQATSTESCKYCLVASVGGPVAEAHRARGMLIRVGHFVQCLLIVGDEVNIERWEYASAEATDTHQPSGVRPAGWVRSVKLGPRFLPCSWFFRAAECREGETLEDETQLWTWTLAEKASW
ncbi:hypothetical protein DAEQUDRAFT_810643 [Daedalea quercina L-15889]|uniref:Protein HRI1 n=1 Tax=Daedalea quercina L-15889 TaxID=1314783 RepID=A0A165R9D4_9APHY|nr:hypothetical protein DAEQUDRAFT_810643 [Daedalea quercina L-15889]